MNRHALHFPYITPQLYPANFAPSTSMPHGYRRLLDATVAKFKHPYATLTDPDHYLNDKPEKTTKRHTLHWPRHLPILSTLQIVGPFLLGCIFALVHHIYCTSLSGKEVGTIVIANSRDQVWASHASSAFAYAAKFSFTTAVGAACIQHLWTAACEPRGIPLDGLDAGFSILHDPLNFFSRELISSAQLIILLALMSWSMPLIAVITPGSLLVVSRNTTTSIYPCAVPSVDLSTQNSLEELGIYGITDGAEYLVSPSPTMRHVATLALLSGTYAVPQSPCGPVCNYTTSFFAPYFTCTEPYDSGAPRRDGDGSAYIWDALFTVQNRSDIPDVFYAEWYGDRQVAVMGGSADTTASEQAQRVNCTAVNATYTVQIEHDGSFHSITRHSVIPMNNFSTIYDPVNNYIHVDLANSAPIVYAAVFQAATTVIAGTVVNRSLPLPSGGVSSPQDGAAHYQDQYTGASAAAIPRSVGWPQSLAARAPSSETYPYGMFIGPTPNQTMVTTSSFGYMNPALRQWIPVSNVGEMIESLMYNITIGLMALNIPGSSSNQVSTDTNPAPNITCIQSEPKNIYSYHRMVLIVPYLIAFACTLFSVLVGLRALWSLQVDAVTGFKRTTEVTRNPDLDFVITGRDVSGSVRLRFGDFFVDGEKRKVFGFPEGA